MARTPNSKPSAAVRPPAAGKAAPPPAATQPPPNLSTARPQTAPTIEPKARPSREEIARAAYFRWLKQGGDPTSNWLAAEQELTRGKVR